MAKTFQKLKINQLENNVFRKFCVESLVGLLSDDTSTDERFFSIDLPIIALISDVCMALDYVKVDYVPIKGITCNPNKFLQYFEYRLNLKPYKHLVYKNNTIMDFIKSFYDTFMREDFQETVNLFMDVLKEASDAGEAMALPKPPTVH